MKWRIKITYGDDRVIKYLNKNGETLVYDSPEEAAAAMHDWVAYWVHLGIGLRERYYVFIGNFIYDVEIIPA